MTLPVMSTRQLFGMAFFYFEDPSTIRSAILEALDVTLAATTAHGMTRVSRNGGERYVAVATNPGAQLRSAIAGHDFSRSLYWVLADGTSSDMHYCRLEFLARRLHPDYAGRSPNYLYLEADLDEPDAWQTFTRVLDILPVFAAFGSPVVAPALERMPRSGAEAASWIRSANGQLKGFYELWGNPSYRVLMAGTDAFLEGPNPHLAIGTACPAHAEIRLALRDSRLNPLALHLGGFALRVPALHELGLLADALRPWFCDPPRPVMFWKPAHWSAWVKAMQCG